MIPVMCSFIYGFPWETLDDWKQTLNFATELYEIGKLTKSSVKIVSGFFVPLPGTELYNLLNSDIRESINWDYIDFEEPNFLPKDGVKEDIQECIYNIRMLEYTSSYRPVGEL